MAKMFSRHIKLVSKKSEQPAPPSPPSLDATAKRRTCPVMGGKCVPGNVVYQGAVTRLDTGHTDYYTGLSEPSWKKRWANHKASFKTDTKQHRTSTCLAKHIWKLKDKRVEYSLSFKQLAQAPGFNPNTNMCRLCLTEKYFIMFQPEGATMNNRS